MDCSRPGTKARRLVPPSMNRRMMASESNMNTAELVNAISTPPMRAIGNRLLIWN